MKNLPLLLAAATIFPLAAQEQSLLQLNPAAENTPTPVGAATTAEASPPQASAHLEIPGLVGPETTEMGTGTRNLIEEATPAQEADNPQLPPAEIHVRKGIALLLKLHGVMAGINSPQTAQKAVSPLVTLSREMLKWTQGFSSLPLLDDDTRILYEDQYLPLLRKINTQLKLQGERLASAKYYGSRDLQAALAHLILTLQ